MVSWQLGTGQSNFIPRLGGPIEAVCACPDGAHVAVLCEGGHLKVVNIQTRRIVRHFRLATIPTISSSKRLESTSVLCSANGQGLVAFGVREAEIEVWDVKGTLVNGLEVTPRNYVSKTDQKEINKVAVKVAAFSEDGTSMATVHGRDKGDAKCQLSMWRLVQGKWHVESRVLSPHRDTITSLSVSDFLCVLPCVNREE